MFNYSLDNAKFDTTEVKERMEIPKKKKDIKRKRWKTGRKKEGFRQK